MKKKSVVSSRYTLKYKDAYDTLNINLHHLNMQKCARIKQYHSNRKNGRFSVVFFFGLSYNNFE